MVLPAKTPFHIAIVAGEASGDLLGAGLINALKKHYPHASFSGIAGPKMIVAGCTTLFPMEKISVMGVTEVVKQLFTLLRLRRQVLKHYLKNPPDVFIGIDSPEFNLHIEERLRRAGVKTVHYVSPSVWAWRKKRIHKIGRAVDVMLTLLPFETAIYEEHQIPVKFVGHPLADQLPLQPDRAAARTALGLPMNVKIMGILPGSRSGELKYLSEPFIKAAQLCFQKHPELLFVVPCVNAARRKQFSAVLNKIAPDLPVLLVDGQAHEVMAAADVLLLASGTVALEAMLLKRPMVVAYKMSPLNFEIAKRVINVDHISLPNIIAGETLVPELIQFQATPENLSQALLRWLEDEAACDTLQQKFTEIHQRIQCDADQTAAQAVVDLLTHHKH